jgi:hypothetical protein
MRRFACAVVLLAVTGCGGKPIHPVQGVVTFDGKPAKSGSIRFVPVGGDENGPLISALVSIDGKYSLKTARGKAIQIGAPPGDYAVFYTPLPSADADKPESIRAITIATVRAGDNDIPIMVLKK